MRIAIFLIPFLLLCVESFAEDRVEFFGKFDPSSASYVYDNEGSTATGNAVAATTYGDKAIQVVIDPLGSSALEISIEGRMIDEPSYSVVSRTEYAIGFSTSNVTGTRVTDLFQVVPGMDEIRVGVRIFGTDGTDSLTVRGLFRTDKTLQ